MAIEFMADAYRTGSSGFPVDEAEAARLHGMLRSDDFIRDWRPLRSSQFDGDRLNEQMNLQQTPWTDEARFSKRSKPLRDSLSRLRRYWKGYCLPYS